MHGPCNVSLQHAPSPCTSANAQKYLLSQHCTGYSKLQCPFSVMHQLLFGGTPATVQTRWGDGIAARVESGERDLALTFVSSFLHD